MREDVQFPWQPEFGRRRKVGRASRGADEQATQNPRPPGVFSHRVTSRRLQRLQGLGVNSWKDAVKQGRRRNASPAASCSSPPGPLRRALSGLSLLLVTSRRSGGGGELSQSHEQNRTAEAPRHELTAPSFLFWAVR